MNNKQKEYCPSGYIFFTNIDIRDSFPFSPDGLGEYGEYSFYIKTIKTTREKYGNLIVTDAFDVLGRPLSNNIVAVYVLHPAIKRINKTLKILKAKRNIK